MSVGTVPAGMTQLGRDCQREAMPADFAPPRPCMCADTPPGLLVDGSRRW